MPRVFFFIICLFCFACASAQKSRFIVIVFDEDYKISMHGTKRFYWVLSADSLGFETEVNYLIKTGFTNEALEGCRSGSSIDPFSVGFGESFMLPEDYSEQLRKFRIVVTSNLETILTQTQKWKSGQRRKVTVYAVPLTGNFCVAKLAKYVQQRYNYQGKVVFPISDFQYDPDFWNSEKAKFIRNRDFLKVAYGVFQNFDSD